MQRLAHPDGELAVSRAAARKNLGMVLATHSTVGLEEVAMQGNGNPYAIHLLMLKDRALMADMIKRAEGVFDRHLLLHLISQCSFSGA